MSLTSPKPHVARSLHEVLFYLRQAVRSIYRAEQRPPQHEPMVVHWIEAYVWHAPDRPLGERTTADVSRFLSHLAERPGISASDQEQAREALLFLYDRVLEQPLDEPLPTYRSVSDAPPSLWDITGNAPA
ncbi:phage integrase N-terminal SAM-like domain-containing protein [Salisaeta longa]|uniref:phage integrase N-terminal SAM-like domain-containing protein n=1 Tax=Salisaeta longa TaxID=503170 RepID=UPI0003B4AE15|nr:phage integrase N-terminal SAM-like domain-containing protein [Salisaeta longa]